MATARRELNPPFPALFPSGGNASKHMAGANCSPRPLCLSGRILVGGYNLVSQLASQFGQMIELRFEAAHALR